MRFEVIVFDLGGVLIELKGVEILLNWTGWPEGELWRRWLTSPSVRGFESGRISAGEFGRRLVEEFDLPLEPCNFVSEFANWPFVIYPGAKSLLDQLASRYRLALLSNTNTLHWTRFENELGITRHFDTNFPSHLTGYLKPDRQAFEHIIRQLACPPERMLFMDDNQLNVDGARDAGLVAYQANGVTGAQAVLSKVGVIGS